MSKFYILNMFPYPSGDGLHVGHALGYVASDIFARYKKMQGYEVLNPMGFDTFGLPTEQYAIQTGQHPAVTTDKNVSNYIYQMKKMCLDFSWDRKFNTSDPDYYKHTQQIFIWMFNSFFCLKDKKAHNIKDLYDEFAKNGNNNSYAFGNYDKLFSAYDWQNYSDEEKYKISLKFRLAYQDDMLVNWCPQLGTVLANDEVINGFSERGGYPVEQKKMRQWCLRITAYADRLLSTLHEKEKIIYSKPLKKDLPLIKRNVVLLIVKHWYDDKLLICEYKEGLHFFITGGVEENEDTISAAIRELREKSGYRNVKKNTLLDINIDDIFYHTRKNVNSYEVYYPVVLELEDGEQDEISAEEKAIQTCKWIDPADLDTLPPVNKLVYDYYLGKVKLKQRLQWSESTKEMQCNWIGRSEGAEINFKLSESDEYIKIFTSRPETIFGVTFIAISKDHFLAKDIKMPENGSGFFTGKYAIHPFTGDKIPIWIVDYVVSDYGTGAVMAVPAHDKRDYDFAQKYNIQLKQVVAKYIFDSEIKEFKTRERQDVCVIIKHWSEDKYLCLDWKTTNWKSFVLGGVEPNETAKDAAIREMREETGYVNIKNIKIFDDYISHCLVAYPCKKENHYAVFTICYVELANGKQDTVDEREKNKHECIWIEKANVGNFIIGENIKMMWSFINDNTIRFKTNDSDKIINSSLLNGLDIISARKKILDKIEELNIGHRKVNYKLRDAVFSRQRYWGEPIPVYYKNKLPYVLSEEELPLQLPDIYDYKPTGEPPLSRAKKWTSKEGYPLETSTMPGWAGSSWYFLRYLDPHNDNDLVSKDSLDKWGNVDLYLGGAEHAVGHLLYSRFYSHFLYDIGKIPFDEPFKKLIHQGMVLGESAIAYRLENTNTFVSYELIADYKVSEVHVNIKFVDNDFYLYIEQFKNWRTDFKNAEFILHNGRYKCGKVIEKMSKSKYNVINPDDVIDKYGSDTLRLYLMFLGPIEQQKPWSTKGIEGAHRFLKRVRNFIGNIKHTQPQLNELKIINHTIKDVKDSIERYAFNTAISSMMICLNNFCESTTVSEESFIKFLLILQPFAPNTSLELLKKLNYEGDFKFPSYEEKYLIDDTVTYAVAINGKTRTTIDFNIDTTEDCIKQEVLTNKIILKLIQDTDDIKKILIIKNKMINIVISG